MIDFHSHILPAFDDGAKDLETSLKMLEKSKAQGVNTVVSTSHIYPYSSAEAEDFIRERQKAYDKLRAGMEKAGGDYPQLRLGAEVHLTCDISRMHSIHDLCIEGTDYLLLEMPVAEWNDSVVDIVYKLSLKGITPIIAHMERNLHQKQEFIEGLYNLDVLIQVNAETFGAAQFRKFTDRMLKNKLLHLVGSDMHNLTSRAPNMDKAHKAVKKRYGEECWAYLMQNAGTILSGEELSYRSLKSYKKRGLFG